MTSSLEEDRLAARRVAAVPRNRFDHRPPSDRIVGVFGQIPHWSETTELAPHPHLTPRQTEVLHLLEHGRSTVQIAAELHLSQETVRNHVRHLLRALGVNSRLEAVAAARAHHAARAAELMPS